MSLSIEIGKKNVFLEKHHYLHLILASEKARDIHRNQSKGINSIDNDFVFPHIHNQTLNFASEMKVFLVAKPSYFVSPFIVWFRFPVPIIYTIHFVVGV